VEGTGVERDLGPARTAPDQHDYAAGCGRVGGDTPGLRPADRFEHQLVRVAQALDAPRAQLRRLGAAFGVGIGDGHRAAVGDQQGGEHQPHRPSAHDPDVGGVTPSLDRVHGRGERLGHRRCRRGQPVGNAMECGLGGGNELGEAAEHPGRVSADLGAPTTAWLAGAAGDRIGYEHSLAGVNAHAGGLVAERARVGREHPVAVAPHLDVGAARGRRLHLDDHLAVRLGHLLHAQIPRSVEERRLHGSTTTFNAVALRWS
jgi:hypothetical protein